MSQMNCTRAHRLISNRLDQPLPPAESAALTAHLRDCAACARFEAQLKTQMGQIARLPVVPRQVPGQQTARMRPSAPVWAWLGRGAQLACAVLAVVLVTRLTTGLLGPRAALRDRPAPTAVVAFESAATPTPAAASPLLASDHATPVSAPRLAFATPASTPTQPTATPPPTATTAPTPTPIIEAQDQVTESVAADVVRRFYAAINARDYRTAFALFDDRWAQTYEDFAGGFADTARDDLDILGVRAAETPDHFLVQVRLLATHDDGSRQWYAGTYEIGGAAGAARIVGADIRPITEDEAAQLAPK